MKTAWKVLNMILERSNKNFKILPLILQNNEYKV